MIQMFIVPCYNILLVVFMSVLSNKSVNSVCSEFVGEWADIIAHFKIIWEIDPFDGPLNLLIQIHNEPTNKSLEPEYEPLKFQILDIIFNSLHRLILNDLTMVYGYGRKTINSALSGERVTFLNVVFCASFSVRKIMRGITISHCYSFWLAADNSINNYHIDI